MEVSGVSVCGLPVRCGPVVVGQGGAAAAARRFPLARGGCSPELPWPMILTRGLRKARARRAARGFDALEGQPAVFRLSRYGGGRHMRRWIWVLLGVIIIGGGLYAWASTARTSGGARQAAVQQRMYIPVERSTIVRTLSYSGSLEPARDETLTAGSAGWIKEVRVAKGDRVKAGDVIARLDDTEAQLELMRARREYEQAKMESPAIVVEERRLALLSAERRRSGTAVTAPVAGAVAGLYAR